MTLDEAYRHIKASYIHHLHERNSVFLLQAELIAMGCISEIKQRREADMQTVVHCKECKHGKEIHFEGDEALPIRYSCKFSNYLMSGDGYCSMGAVMEGKD